MAVSQLDKVIYSARASVTGGRTGHGATDDGALDVELHPPGAPGGPEGATNPEQLFAIGYAACFLSALSGIARRERVDVTDAQVRSLVDLGRDGAGYGLAVELSVDIPGQDPATVRRLADAAHQACPYSRAVRGNVPVDIVVVGES